MSSSMSYMKSNISACTWQELHVNFHMFVMRIYRQERSLVHVNDSSTSLTLALKHSFIDICGYVIVIYKSNSVL